MQEYYIKLQATYVLDICYISKTYVLRVNKNKTRTFLHIIVSIKGSLQKQIQFNGNIFGNKCCRCNEGSLYC